MTDWPRHFKLAVIDPKLFRLLRRFSARYAQLMHPQSMPALKHMLDFNHKIYVDGTTWTNKAGKSYHFYRILDAGTNYNVAISAPSKTTEDFIHMMTQQWISWAGPPVVDSDNFDTHLSHTTLSHTILHTHHLSYTPSFTHQLCHTPSFTH
jgi:hypothetical protein